MVNFLKSTVSTFVLLSTFAIQNPSFAGNTGVGGEEKPKKGIHKKNNEYDVNVQELVNKKQKFTSKQGEEDRKFFHFYEELTAKEDVLKIILFYLAIDKFYFPKDQDQNPAFVSKYWYKLIHSQKQTFRNAILLNSGEQHSKANFPFLRGLFTHPLAVNLAFDLLSPEFPFQCIYSKFNPTLKKMMDKEVQPTVPKNIENYISIVNSCSSYHSSFCNYLSNLNPLNFKAVGLGAHIIQQSNSLQALLNKEIENNSMSPEKFSKLVTDYKKHPQIKKHLMTLKLLALSGDTLSEDEIKKWESGIDNYYWEHFDGVFDSNANDSKIFKRLLSQPLWSTYIVHVENKKIEDNEATIFDREISILDFCFDSRFKKSIKVDQIKAFADYVKIIVPQTKNLVGLLKNLQSLEFMQHEKTSLKEVDFLKRKYDEINKENLLDYGELAYSFFEIKQYETAMEILKEAYQKAEDSPIRFYLLERMANFILQKNDQDNFSQAQQYLLTLQNAFNQVPGNLQIDYTYDVIEKGIKTTETIPITILKIKSVIMFSALEIFKGNFDSAYKHLKEHFNNKKVDLEDYPELLKALQIQKDNMPEKLKKLFARELKYMGRSDLLETQKLVLEHKDLFEHMLEKKLVDKKVKTKIELIQSNFQLPDSSSEEEKEKGDKSFSKKTNKKRKK